MKRFLISALLIVCLSSACVQRKYHGVKTAQSSSHFGLFAKVDSCTPTLTWEAQLDPSLTYDVEIHKALITPNDSIPPEKGELVYYKELIPKNSIKIETPLKPNSKYLWSVRFRKLSGEVGQWSTYDKSLNGGIGYTEYRNIWFGIKTPNCLSNTTPPTLSSENKTEENLQKGSDIKTFSGHILTDSYLQSLLEKGWGGIILRNRGYAYKDATHVKQYHDWEDWIAHEGKEYQYNNLFLYILPSGQGREISLSPYNFLFMIVVPPGEYVLSRVTSNDFSGITSRRLFAKVLIEGKKMKYVGDVVSLIRKGPLGGVMSASLEFTYKPEEFQSIQKTYPLSSSFMVVEKLADIEKP